MQKTLYRFLWAPPICVVKKDYHGPNCNKILEDNVLQKLKNFLPQEEELQQYVVMLKAMRGLKKSCFSSHKLDISIGASFEFKWKEHHQKFIDAYSQVPIKRVGPNKRVGWIFIKYFCLSLCLFLSSCFFGAK